MLGFSDSAQGRAFSIAGHGKRRQRVRAGHRQFHPGTNIKSGFVTGAHTDLRTLIEAHSVEPATSLKLSPAQFSIAAFRYSRKAAVIRAQQYFNRPCCSRDRERRQRTQFSLGPATFELGRQETAGRVSPR